MEKRIIKNSKLSNAQIKQIVGGFLMATPALRLSKKMLINRHSIERVYIKIRQSIAGVEESELFEEETSNLLKSGDNNPIVGVIYNTSTKRIETLILGKISDEEIKKISENRRCSDELFWEIVKVARYRSPRSYHEISLIFLCNFDLYLSLANAEEFFYFESIKHPWIGRYDRLFKKEKSAINFLIFANKFIKQQARGFNKDKIYLYLKELEWRFNNREFDHERREKIIFNNLSQNL